MPDEMMRRRYCAGTANFFELYKPLPCIWKPYNNSEKQRPKLIASGGLGSVTTGAICNKV